MCLKSRHGPETLALSKQSRSASHPSRTEARECLEEAQGTEACACQAPKVGCLSEILSFGSENADAFRLSPHLISICK